MKVEPIQVFVIQSCREDGVPISDSVCGIFRTPVEAQEAVKRLGLWYATDTRWAIIEDLAERTKVFLLPRMGKPEPLLVGVVFSEEKERLRKEALSKLTPEEIEALGVKA